jgi:hypothetical protein
MINFKDYLLENSHKLHFNNAERAYTKTYEWGFGRCPEAEEVILKERDPQYTYMYARDIIEGRWPEAEDIIKENPWTSYWYASNVVEDTDWITEEDKLRWLKAGINEKLIRMLSTIGLGKTCQEYVLQQRPDLIGLIKNLDPKLAEKYAHELELGNLDL